MANTFNSVKQQNVGTTAVDVYTVPASTSAVVIGMTCANKITTETKCTVQIISGVTTTILANSVSIPTNETYVPIGGVQKIVLKAGEKIRVFSNTANSIDVIVSMLEIA